MEHTDLPQQAFSGNCHRILRATVAQNCSHGVACLQEYYSRSSSGGTISLGRQGPYRRSPKPFSESFLIRSSMPCQTRYINPDEAYVSWQLGSYLWHNGPPIAANYISERHLRAFVLTDLQFGVVDVGDLVNRNYGRVSTRSTPRSDSSRTPLLNDHPGDSNGSICRHLHGAQPATLVTLLAKL